MPSLPTNVTIRPLAETDAAAYRELRLEMLKHVPTAFGSSYEEEAPRSLDAIQERLRPCLGKGAFGAFCADRLVGACGIYSDGRNKTKHKISVWGMYVASDWRGKGVGESLVRTAIESARLVPNADILYLSVEATNETAKRLYARLGFQVWGVEPRALRVNGQFYDEAHMWLALR